jgi:hypothetical protein
VSVRVSEDRARARRLFDALSEEGRRAALSYLEFLAYVEEAEPPLTEGEREAVARFRAGEVSHLIPAEDVWAGKVS